MSNGRLTLVLLLAAIAGAAHADPQDRGSVPEPRESRPGREHESRPEEHSLAESVRRVERVTRGQILSAERVPFEGRDLNRIKVLDQTGRVRVITEDPRRPPRDKGNDD